MTDNSARVVIDAEGEWTIYTAAAIVEKWRESVNAADVIEIDMAKAHEIDTAGLQILLALDRLQKNKGEHAQLKLTNVTESVQETLSFLRLNFDGARS